MNESFASILLMRILYTAPFRVPFSLTKQEALADHDRFVGIVERAAKDLDKAQLPNAQLGNYGWGAYDPSRENVPTHGEKGIDDPTWFFRDFYTLSFGEILDAGGMPDGSAEPVVAGVLETARERWWACRLVDNTVALLILNAELPFDAFAASLKAMADGAAGPRMIDYGNAWCERVLSRSRKTIVSAYEWATKNLTDPMRLEKGPAPVDIFDSLRSPAYGLPEKSNPVFRAMWAHCMFVFTEEERQALRELEAPFLSLMASPDLAKSWLDGGDNAYGWGASAVLQAPRFEDQWLEGLCISQYYYACVDIADQALPVAIAEQRTALQSGSRTDVMERTKDLRDALIILQSDYADQRVRSSAEGRRALDRYFEVWDFVPLLEGLQLKIELLSALTTAASESLARLNERRVQFILTAITVLGLISVFSGIHDYLAGGYDPSDPSWLPSVAVTVSKVAVLVASFAVAVLAFLAWILLSRRR